MDTESKTLGLDDRTYLLVLTGAGVSAESGIPTFRDANGLWENHRFEDVASPEGWRKDPALVWRFYSERRKNMKGALPNAGHRALAEVEQRLGDRFLLATQNIDGLHKAAGSKRVVEMHGNLFTSRCADPACDLAPLHDEDVYEPNNLPACGRCQKNGRFSLLRPHIVWFGEALDARDLQRVEDFMNEGIRSRLVFLAAGTSGVVYPAAGLVSIAARAGADTWLVNADPPDNLGRFRNFVRGKSGEVLPKLFADA